VWKVYREVGISDGGEAIEPTIDFEAPSVSFTFQTRPGEFWSDARARLDREYLAARARLSTPQAAHDRLRKRIKLGGKRELRYARYAEWLYLVEVRGDTIAQISRNGRVTRRTVHKGLQQARRLLALTYPYRPL
jgi:hypothetical protein